MIIIKFWGGLGNQMFQYALYRSLEKRGKKVYADCSFYTISYDSRKFCLNTIFPNIRLKVINDKLLMKFISKYKNRKFNRKIIDRLYPEKSMMYREHKEGEFDSRVFCVDDIMLEGYWQSEKYFSDIKTNLMNELKFNILDKDLLKMAKKIRNDECSVSVHFRRGDYLEKDLIYGKICTENYYKSAIDIICKVHNNPQFYIFSDDTDWVKKLYTEGQYEVIEKSMFKEYEDWFDLYLMSLCKHNIIANSSFSWWGAWLNSNLDKKVIAPKKWMNTKKTSDIWCEGWYKI